MPAGRASMQMTLASQGRSASALTGRVVRKRHRDAGIRCASPGSIRARSSSRSAPAMPGRRPTTPGCGRSSSRCCRPARCRSQSAQIPFTITGRPASRRRHHARCRWRPRHRVRWIRYSRRPGRHSRHPRIDRGGAAPSRPEIQLFAAGSPDALNRTVDVAALSSWLAVRAIDRETRRLDSIERGERPPAAMPASIPPPSAPIPGAVPTDPSLPDVLNSGRDPRRPLLKPKASVPRPSAIPSSPPVVSQQVAPLPPPIEVRPAPNVVRQPRLRAPLVLTPPVVNPPRPSF